MKIKEYVLCSKAVRSNNDILGLTVYQFPNFTVEYLFSLRNFIWQQ